MIETIDIGDQVLCDRCSADFTNRTESGFLFGSKAVRQLRSYLVKIPLVD